MFGGKKDNFSKWENTFEHFSTLSYQNMTWLLITCFLFLPEWLHVCWLWRIPCWPQHRAFTGERASSSFYLTYGCHWVLPLSCPRFDSEPLLVSCFYSFYLHSYRAYMCIFCVFSFYFLITVQLWEWILYLLWWGIHSYDIVSYFLC